MVFLRAIVYFLLIVLLVIDRTPADSEEDVSDEISAPNATAEDLKENRVFKFHQERHLLLIEPRSMRSDVFLLIPDAKHTVYSAGYFGLLGVMHYKAEEFRKLYRGGWKEFRHYGLQAATKHLKTLKPNYIRDANDVIEYGMLQADHPLTATTVIVPEFREIFKKSLGENLLIAIPNRSTVLIFPKFANTMESYKKTLSNLYSEAIYPVSREFFELTDGGIRAIGNFKHRE